MPRIAAYPISNVILNRWSPRAMTGEPITDVQLMTLFEAARWAPSSFNNQPWRFLYAKRESSYWDLYLNLLVQANKDWCKDAAVLVVLFTRNNFEYNEKPSRTHSFDAGAAWENVALQGSVMNLLVHGMEGFDYDRAKKDLHIPDDCTVQMMFAVGHKAPSDEEMNDRKSLKEIVKEGIWK